jgi:hypothetical protein
MSEQKPKKSKKTGLKFKFDSDTGNTGAVGPDDLTKAMRSDGDLAKSVEPQPYQKDLDPKVDRNKLVFSAYQAGAENLESKAWGRMSDEELKNIARVDPYISAIISKRASQCAVIGRLSDSKFDKGTRIQDINPPQKEDFATEDAYNKAVESRKTEMKKILDWVMSCGYNEKSVLNTIFTNGDQLYKHCTFSEYVVGQARNLLTFGRIGMHVMRDEKGLPSLFRPTPIETIYTVKDRSVKTPVPNNTETQPQSTEDAKDWNDIEPELRPTAYVQRVNGMDTNFFTEDDMKLAYFQKQAYFDLNGYPLAPIELAIYMVFIHQQALGYLKNQFIKGITTKSILAIKSIDPSVMIADEDLDQLRREFHNYVLRTDNSAVTPVISGPFDVEVIPLTPSTKDMEFLQLEDHIIRALCTAMQITPQEMGYGYLGDGNGGLSNNNKQEEIIRGEETGLRMLLDTIYDQVNEILYESFQGFKENYRLVYTGVGEDTRENVLARSQQELQTTATMNSLLADSEKTEVAPYGGDVPLAPAFHQNVVRYMKYGDFMEHYFKVEGASKIPEYDFLIDPNLNQAYQQLRTMPIEMQKEQAKLQLESQEQQMQMQSQQMQMAEQQAQAQAQQGADPNAQQQPPQMPDQKASLKDKYKEVSGSPDLSEDNLNKSMSYYFESWIEAHTSEKLD